MRSSSASSTSAPSSSAAAAHGLAPRGGRRSGVPPGPGRPPRPSATAGRSSRPGRGPRAGGSAGSGRSGGGGAVKASSSSSVSAAGAPSEVSVDQLRRRPAPAASPAPPPGSPVVSGIGRFCRPGVAGRWPGRAKRDRPATRSPLHPARWHRAVQGPFAMFHVKLSTLGPGCRVRDVPRGTRGALRRAAAWPGTPSRRG